MSKLKTNTLEHVDGSSVNITLDSSRNVTCENNLTVTGLCTAKAFVETQTTKSGSFTPNLTTEGGVFSCSGTMTITMPTATAGRSFTIIHAQENQITWGGTIEWNGGSAPTLAAQIGIFVFISDGTNWYGMQSGTGFA